MINFMFRPFVYALFLTLFSSNLFAQDEQPAPEADAVDSTEYVVVASAGASADSGGAVYESAIYQKYRSASLRRDFVAQWMYVDQGGRRATFWGARIIRLDSDSTLRSLGVRSGDVIARLDGPPIWRGIFKEPGKQWQLVELENHFGLTEVRYIARGTHQVRVRQINNDSSDDYSSSLPP